MGAVGSHLGIGRPAKSRSSSKTFSPNMPNANHFLPGPVPGRQALRGSTSDGRHAYLGNGKQAGGSQFSKLMRQTSNLSGANLQSRFTHQQSPAVLQQTVPKLVDVDQHMSEADIKFNREFSLAKPEDIKTLVASYDYSAPGHEDLDFVRGEHLQTCRSLMEVDWWLARSLSTQKCGYVPRNYVMILKSHEGEPWYFPKIGRAVAERALRSSENSDGSFIIRDSDSSKQEFSLSVRHENDIKHYRIRRFEQGGFYIAKRTVFSTIQDLVGHYSIKPDGLCINLRQPCVNSIDGPTTFGLSHDTYDEWEIDRQDLKLLNELGRGQFGQVFEGIFKDKVRVAIKTLRKGSMEPQDFLAEAQIMKRMRHKNLVQLHAVCTREEPVYIVTELMIKGALINYLQSDEGKRLHLCDYVNMAAQIASGMSYLERESYVHRDLAARNILVGENNVCKIADFGLARFIKETEYEARAGARFPIKWTAPEAANYSKFTIKSDVWSFGIVLYEIITKGGTPYPDMSNAEVLSRIEKGYRMPQPPNCDSKYYGIMADCWKQDAQKRPTFESLTWRLDEYFNSDEQYRDVNIFRER